MRGFPHPDSQGFRMKTFSAKAHEIVRDWFVVDATDKVLGHVAAEVAYRLRGKHNAHTLPPMWIPAILSWS
jgi:LSU ribosomal protein L13P